MKKLLFLLISVLSCVFVLSSFANAQSDREYILAKKSAWQGHNVYDLGSCQEKAKLKYSYDHAVGNVNQSTSDYFRSIEHHYRLDLEACKRKW